FCGEGLFTTRRRQTIEKLQNSGAATLKSADHRWPRMASATPDFNHLLTIPGHGLRLSSSVKSKRETPDGAESRTEASRENHHRFVRHHQLRQAHQAAYRR